MNAVNNSQNNVEKFMQMQLLTQMLQSASGEDSNSFQLVMESMLNVMQDNPDSMSSLGIGEQDLTSLGYGGGQPLQDFVQDVQRGVNNDINSSNVSINEAVQNAANKYGVDKQLIMSVIKQESSFNPDATSSTGAMGLMQLMPGTASSMGVTNPYDIEQNVDGGTKYLRSLLDMYGNSKELALAAYNAGPGAVAKSNGVPGYKETQNYVRKVMQYYNGK